jgi:transcriptional regulator with XRE-family HTH domain
MRLTDRQRKVGRTIYNVQHELLRALIEEKAWRRVTQQAVARKLGVDRSVVNRQLTGRANLTLRSLAELAWALDREVELRLVPHAEATKAGRRPASAKTWEQIDPQHSDTSGLVSRGAARLFKAMERPPADIAGATNDNWEFTAPAEAAEAA